MLALQHRRKIYILLTQRLVATYTSIEQRIESELQACIQTKNLKEGRRIHTQILQTHLCLNKFVMNQVMRMYGKCGSVEEVRGVFDSIAFPNQYSWNILIAAFAQNGHLEQAKQMFDRAPNKDVVTWNALFQAYAFKGQFAEAKRTFDEMPNKDAISWNAMLAVNAQQGHLDETKRMFDLMPEPNMRAWNTICQAYAESRYVQEAKSLFDGMPAKDVVAWTTVLTAFAEMSKLSEAEDLFERMPARDAAAWNAMSQAHALHGDVQNAKAVFDSMPQRDVVSWTALLGAIAQNGHLDATKYLFDRIPLRNVVSWNVLLQAYAQDGHIDDARRIFDTMPTSSISWNLMINAYSDQGYMREARALFERVPEKNSVSWTTMLAAYVQNGYIDEACYVFELMPQKNVIACTVMIAAYSQAADVDTARVVFLSIPDRNLFSWNTMVATYAQNGHGDKAVEVFYEMGQEGIKPDPIAFMTVLTACNHGGLIETGLEIFLTMLDGYGTTPGKEHYRCVVDILGRAGRLADAEELVQNMPYLPDEIAWASLLSSCKVHRNMAVGVRAAETVFSSSPRDPATYVLMQNVYAAAGKFEEVAKVKDAIVARGIKKPPGISTIEIDGVVHKFIVGDKFHPRNDEIRSELERLSVLIKGVGYVPDADEVLHPVSKTEKEHLLLYHSEKMAVALGLLETPPGTQLRVVKNIRVCNDCHTAIKFISGVAGRRIIVRDACRFHHFENGACSCRDYW